MEINLETATALGEKLVTLNLSNEEGALLTVLLGEEAEVAGFSVLAKMDGLRTEVLGPLLARWKPEAGSYLTIIVEN